MELRNAQHNHQWLEPTDGLLFHPESDPRILQDSCEACKEHMKEWFMKEQQLMENGD